MQKTTCCFIGHRDTEETEELKAKVLMIIENLIVYEKVDKFLFGSRSNFNDLCYKAVTAAKAKYPYIKRVYVRAEYPQISEDYKNYILRGYEDTYFPGRVLHSGKAAYVERNRDMIDQSRFCIAYYKVDAPTAQKVHPTATRKSGTAIALTYAQKQGKTIINTAFYHSTVTLVYSLKSNV